MAIHTTRSRTHPDNRHSTPKLSLAITGIAAAVLLLAWNAGLFNFWNAVPPAELAALQIEAAKSPAQRDADAKARQAQIDMSRELAKKAGTVTGSP